MPDGLGIVDTQGGGGGGIVGGLKKFGSWFGNGLFGSNKPDPALNASLPYFEQDRQRLGGMMNGRSPYAGAEWGGLISQLQNQAAGTGPSLAQQSYARAAQDTNAAMSSAVNGTANPANARTALIQRGRVGQGMASGLATARTQEQMGAQSALAQALGSRDQMNQSAYMGLLGAQLGLSEAQLRAMLGNQSYAATVAGQPTGLQRGLGTIGGIATGLAGL